MPTSGWLMIGCCQDFTGRFGKCTSSPSMRKNFPLSCRMSPVPGTVLHPTRASSSIRRTAIAKRDR